MNVWLINPHDAVPGEQWGYKHGMILAETLAARQFNVTYWASNFSHATKRYRCTGWGEIAVKPNLRILMVPVSPYTKHVSIARLKSLLSYSVGLYKAGRAEPKPDALILTIPTPFSDYAAVSLSQHHKAKLICDFRDLWPEIFSQAFPRQIRKLATICLAPLYWSRRYALENCHGLTAVCETYLRFAQSIVPRLRRVPTQVVYSTGIRFRDFQCLRHESEAAASALKKREAEVWAIYAGTLGNNYDVPALMSAAKILADNCDAQHVKIIVSGDGPMRSVLIDFIEKNKLSNLIYIGVVGLSQLYEYYAKSDMGLCIYAPGSTVVIPAKAFDYYAAGLPIVSSLNGEFHDYLSRHSIGIKYDAGDPVSLASNILKLAVNKELRVEMGKRVTEIAPLFDCDLQYSGFVEILTRSLLP